MACLAGQALSCLKRSPASKGTEAILVCLQVKYKENYHQIKDKYTTVLETADYDRTKNLKSLYSSVSCLFLMLSSFPLQRQ